MRTSRALLGSIVLVLALGYTNAGAPTSFGGAIREDLLTASTTAANAGDMILWFTPATAIPAGGTITFESDTVVATAANTACTVKSNDGATTIPISDTASETAWTTTKILTVTTKTTEIVAGKVVSVKCPKAQLANLGGGAADVKFKVKTSTDTTYTALGLGYIISAGLVVTGSANGIAPTAARTANYKTGINGGDLVVTFTPTKKTATNAAIKITASAATWTADGTAGDCTVHQMNPETGVMTAISTTGVESSTVSGGAGKINTIATAAPLVAGLPVKVWCDGTKNMAVNVAGLNKIRLETQADTTKTADTDAGCPLTLSHANVVGTAVTWTSAARTNLVVGTAAATAGDLVITFTPAVAIQANDHVTITASQGIFLAAAAVTTATATGNNPSAALAIATAATTKTVETPASIPLGTAAMKNQIELKIGAAASVHPIVITIPKALLADNPATPSSVTFSISTARDTGTLFAQTGYTYTCPTSQNLVGGACITPSSSSSAANGTTAAAGASAAASSNPHTTVTQAYTFPSLTTATYTGNTKGNMECAYANNVEAATTPTWCVAATGSRTYKAGIAMSSSVARRAATVTFTLKVDTTVLAKSALETKVATSSTAAKFAAALAAVNTGTGFNITDPGTATNVATATFTSSTSGASSLLPSMLGLVSALFIAFKHM